MTQQTAAGRTNSALAGARGTAPEVGVRFVGALLAVTVAAVHIADQGGITALASPAWMGWGYRLVEAGGILTAVVLLLPGALARSGMAARPQAAARPGMAARPQAAARPGMAARPQAAARPGMAARPQAAARPGMAGRPGMARPGPVSLGPVLLGPATAGWAAGVLLGAGPFLGYIASRTVGVPGDSRDVGNWGYWVGTVSLLVEAALVLLSITMLAATRRR